MNVANDVAKLAALSTSGGDRWGSDRRKTGGDEARECTSADRHHQYVIGSRVQLRKPTGEKINRRYGDDDDDDVGIGRGDNGKGISTKLGVNLRACTTALTHIHMQTGFWGAQVEVPAD